MKSAFRKPYVYWVLGIFFVYLALNFLLSGFYDTLILIIIYAKTIDWLKLSLSLILTILIGFLVAVNLVYFYLRYKERADCKKEGTLAGAGAVGGLAVGICPLCVTGLVPLFLSLIGISFTFASLPFQGLEIQVLVVIILLLSLRMVTKPSGFF